MNRNTVDPLKWMRPEVARIQAYEGEPTGPEIRLDANESPYDMPEALKREILDSFQSQSWNRYPDPNFRVLRQGLAVWEGVDPQQILVGNGSDEIIRDLITTFVGPDGSVVFPAPTFSMYGLLALAGGSEPVEVALRDDWTLDIDRLLAALNQPKARLLFLANPNNPTGGYYPRPEIESILQATDRLVVVDEAYRLFAGESVADLTGRYPHLLVMNTFSKSMSMAGLRIGYLVASEELIGAVNRIRLPYNLDAFAQAAATVALRHKPLWLQRAEEVMRERERMAAALRQVFGVTVYPSRANFILVKLPNARECKTELAAAGIAVRGFGENSRLSGCLRISIGQPNENDRLLEHIRRHAAGSDASGHSGR